MTTIEIPADWPVQPVDLLTASPDVARNSARCGTCHLSWDDSIPTSMTPAPSARCPFEPFHRDSDVADGEVWYTVPVVAEIRDGEVWAVRVMDEAITLAPTEDTDNPVVQLAESAEWPSWSFG